MFTTRDIKRSQPLKSGAPAAHLVKHRKEQCSACHGPKLLQAIDLPALPLTGIYVKTQVPGKYPGVDQGLMLCRDCGHAQLMNVLEPSYVYGDTYTHRSSMSSIAMNGNQFFYEFLKKTIEGVRFDRILDIGCNDLFLLNKLEPLGSKLLGVDPIWRGREPKPTEKIKVLGKFIEEIDLEQELGGKPDLIISSHTFEHIEDPRTELKRLIEHSAREAVFVIEVPCFDTLLDIGRFDQIFHQHIQYFSRASVQRMITDLGCEIISHTFNHDFWGGTLLVAFQGRTSRSTSSGNSNFIAHPEQEITSRYSSFRSQLATLMETVSSLDGTPVHGYGAAQVLPTLAYHMGSDLSFLKQVFDDDVQKEGYGYPELYPRIYPLKSDFELQNAAILITALDSARAILNRIIPLRPRRILLPLNIV